MFEVKVFVVQRESLAKKIRSSIFVFVVLWAILAVVHKFCFKETDWSWSSFAWSFAWGVAHFIGQTIASVRKITFAAVIFIELMLCVITGLVMYIIFDMMLIKPELNSYIYTVISSLLASFVVNNDWRKMLFKKDLIKMAKEMEEVKDEVEVEVEEYP